MINIREELGFPKEQASMGLDSLINAVLSINHPEKPTHSDISNKEFGIIDKNSRAAVTLLNQTQPPIYSNILIITKSEYEELQRSLFYTKTYVYSFDENSSFKGKVSATYYIPQLSNPSIVFSNRQLFLNFAKEMSMQEPDDESLTKLLLRLIKNTKGIVSVSLDAGDIVDSISIYDLIRTF